MERSHGREFQAVSSAPIKKLPASPRVSQPGIPVADRGGEEVNVCFGDFGAGRSNQLRDPRARRSPGNDREFSFGNRFYMGPLLYHIKEVMFYSRKGEICFPKLLLRRRAAQSPKSCVEHLRLLVGKDSIADALLRHFGSLKALSRAWPR